MITRIAQTASTSADLAARLRGGEHLAEGDWLVADRQTSGRGRMGRDWIDGAGNFMGSTAARLTITDPDVPTLALVAGLAVHETVSAHLAPPNWAMLKWPNDVMIGYAKLAGVLLEREGGTVIIGIGVNLSTSPDLPDRRAVSLAAFGKAPDRDEFAAGLAECFARHLYRWHHYGSAPIIDAWTRAAHPLGTPIRADDPREGTIEGTFAGLSVGGTLQLRLADGSIRAIHSGEIHLA